MAKKKITNTDIIFVGAGAVGMICSLLLSRAGFKVALIEKNKLSLRRPKKLTDGHTTALMNKSLAVIKETGVWNQVEPFAQNMDVLRIIDTHAQDINPVDFTAQEIGKRTFGMNVPQTPLRAALMKQVKKDKGVLLKEKAEIDAHKTEGAKVTLSFKSGESIEGKLLIAGDGRNSFIRQMLGIKTKQKQYEQTALTFLISHSLPHENVSTEIHKEGGPLTFVPLKNNMSSVVWVERTEKAEILLKLKKQELTQTLQDKSRNILGALKIETDVKSWPLSSHCMNTLKADRVLFIGEAAHGFSPVGAQGLNLSMRDVDLLVDHLKEAARLGQDIGSETILSQYEKKRKHDMLKRYYGVDLLNHFIRSESAFEKKLRLLGLNIVSSIKPLKHILMREGMSPVSKKSA